MKRKIGLLGVWIVVLQMLLMGCDHNNAKRKTAAPTEEAASASKESSIESISPTEKILQLEDGLSVISVAGDFGFERFLEAGGAKSDSELVSFISEQLLSSGVELTASGNPFGCSTFSVKSSEEGYLFGRNFDWEGCEALIVQTEPEQGYASVSTVNLNFIQSAGVNISSLPDQMQGMIASYVPLDGLNEKGLALSVNMISDSAAIEQNTEKPDLTATSAIRLLLNQAADVEEALDLLEQYDMHASMGMMVHFAIADAKGNSVAVEYVDNKMVVNETQVLTNYYLAKGEKQGIGTEQSHTRFEILTQTISEHGLMREADVKEALDSVSKDNFDEYESTEWSIVMNQETKKLTYYHREHYETGYSISVE